MSFAIDMAASRVSPVYGDRPTQPSVETFGSLLTQDDSAFLVVDTRPEDLRPFLRQQGAFEDFTLIAEQLGVGESYGDEQHKISQLCNAWTQFTRTQHRRDRSLRQALLLPRLSNARAAQP
ncbi:MAG: hypothetical protein AAF512_24050 [Pseudomonadota bacterium]